MSARFRLALLASLILSAGAAHADSGVAPDLVKRGEYLARAGDCFSCHTKEGGTPLAGGRQVDTPFGSISSPNITPDKDTGIGDWTDDQFYKLMHDGIDKAGDYVYPVMPFDHYTKVTRDDVMAIKAFLFSVKPVHAPRAESHLAFPFNIRTSLLAWRTLFFHEGTFKPDPHLSDAENRGAYLVEGLGHCGACHTPRDIAMGSDTSEALGGGEIKGQGWFAPNISSDVHEGIGAWSQQQLVQYLKEGVAPGRAVVAGPMAEVVHTSLTYLTDADLAAIAAYLKVSPGKALYTREHFTAPPGGEAYLNNCAFCHQPDGKGIAGAVPPLAGNGAVLAGGPEDVIRAILGGIAAQGQYAPMPGFAKTLTSGQIAAIANYVRTSWGNAAPATATQSQVDMLAKTTASMLAGTAGCDPVKPPAVASALDAPDVTSLLANINSGNMLEQIDAALPKLRAAAPNITQTQIVNGMIAAYCPLARPDPGRPAEQRIELLQRFAMLVYSQVSSRGLSMQDPPAGQAKTVPVAN
jgi:mono/diheme cytochrome c family protein